MQSLLLRHPWAPFGLGAVPLTVITALLIAVDAFSPAQLPGSFVSIGQLVGTDILLIVIPTFLMTAWGLLLRRSVVLLRQVDELSPDHQFEARVRTPLWVFALGAVIGGVYAVVFNLPVDSVRDLTEGGSLLTVLVLCMILLWTCVGVILASRLFVASLFFDAGRAVPVDPYDQSTLEPFAHSGMSDMLLVVGALVLSAVQSIDATFRYENYLYGSIVALPAALVLLLWPMASVHGRLKACKSDELAAVNVLIRAAPKSLEQGDISPLETLLKRRDRIKDIPVWPLNTSMVSRLVVYGIIPPVAWIAAALVERLVEDVLGR